MQTQGQADAAKVQRQEAAYSRDLFQTGFPGMQLALSGFLSDLGNPGEEPQSITTAFNTIRQNQNKQFDQQETGAPITTTQQAKQSGARMDPNATKYGADYLVAGLEQQRRAAARQLNEQEVDASLSQRDFDLSNILGIASGGISSSFGFGADRLAYDQADTRNPWGGALTGAASGAAAGTEVYPGWGTVIGAVAGGAMGYFSGGG